MKPAKGRKIDDRAILLPFAGFELAEFAPGPQMPPLLTGTNVSLAGTLERREDGGLHLRPDPRSAGVYLLGQSRLPWVDTVGRWALLLVTVGVFLHAVLRLVLGASRREATLRAAEEEAR